jgi:hypothetical protein
MNLINLNHRSKHLERQHKELLSKLLVNKLLTKEKAKANKKEKTVKILVPIKRNKNLVFNVLDYGVRRNNTTTNVVSKNVITLNNIFYAAAQYGATVYFPNGIYYINGPITLNCNPNGTNYSKQCSIMGESTSGTCIYQNYNSDYSDGYPSFTILGYSESNMSISNLYFSCPDSSLTGSCAIYLEPNTSTTTSITNINISNVTIGGGYIGIYAGNVFSSLFQNVFISWSGYCGIYFPETSTGGYPNSLTFINCNVSSCGTYGYYFNGGTTISITGGGVQGNGTLSESGATGAGIYIYDAGADGSNNLSISGVYFEANNGLADIYIEGKQYSYTSSISSCNFNRLNSTYYTTYNIYNTNTNTSTTSPTYCICSINACGFGLAAADTGGNDYVESSSCPYIYTNSNEYAPCSWTNCYFNSSTAKPSIKNAIDNGDYGNIIK